VLAKVWDRVVGPKALDQVNQRNQLSMATLVTANVDTVVVVPDILEGGGDVSLAGSIHGRGYINSPLLLPQDQWLFLAFARFRCDRTEQVDPKMSDTPGVPDRGSSGASECGPKHLSGG
jgi:hypothetical protein